MVFVRVEEGGGLSVDGRVVRRCLQSGGVDIGRGDCLICIAYCLVGVGGFDGGLAAHDGGRLELAGWEYVFYHGLVLVVFPLYQCWFGWRERGRHLTGLVQSVLIPSSFLIRFWFVVRVGW